MIGSDQGGLFNDPRGDQLALTTPPPTPPGPPGLDDPQDFTPANSYEVRAALEKFVRRDLLGPWDGEREEFPPRAMGPRERYLVGMLGPKHVPTSSRDEASDVPDVEAGVNDSSDGELPEVFTAQNLGRIWASSMGLSFAVPLDVDVLSVRVQWGQYGKRETLDPDGKTRTAWVREPIDQTNEVRLDGLADDRIPLSGSPRPGVQLAVCVRPQDDRRVVELTLINGQSEPDSNKDAAWLFQSVVTVTALDGAAPIFLPIDDPVDGSTLDALADDPEEAHLRLLYRNQRRYAAGHNIAIHPEVGDGQRNAHQLQTTWMPYYDVPATIAPSGEGSALSGVELSMDVLATADPDALRAGLSPLVDGYLAWLGTCRTEVDTLPHALQATASHAIDVAQVAAGRIRAGVDLLTDPTAPRHAEALRAFRFANEAMAMQRRRTALALRRAATGESYPAARAAIDAEGAKAASWRPFQLAFVLLNLPSLTDPLHRERSDGPTGLVDLLFFPTGGGKTEAYLGLTAYTFAIRRLQGTIGTGAAARSGNSGVAVLMRYTLRLLTAQQFQRAAALVCAAEMIRREAPSTWGPEPFSIGLWVGGSVSPNWFDDAKDQIDEAREAGDGRRANVLQTLTCPWCGTTLTGEKDLHADVDTRRAVLYCANDETNPTQGKEACPFSRPQSPHGLPIRTVDEEIYRYTPSLVIATVDKLAQLPWKGYAGHLFGRVREWCPRHGYRHDDLDVHTGCASKHNAKGDPDNGGQKAVSSQPVVRLRPPDLIIQDELHLISGALGTTVGLFESAVDELCRWEPAPGQATGPKIVASTATTKRAREQVLGIFGRDLAVFPPQVLDVSTTFFSEQVPVTQQAPGRRYLGVCAHGVRLKQAEIRLAEILLIAGQTLYDQHGQAADPYMTLVGYFNATRELAGMRRYLDDDVTTRIRRHGRIKGPSSRLPGPTAMLTVQELTSRISSGDISDVLKRLEVGFDPEIDTSARRTAVQRDIAATFSARDSRAKDRPTPHPLSDRYSARIRDEKLPVDVVLATSMLQVGVDVSRFGLMMVTGQPKNTAEYIQASSRVGRDAARPGLVVTLYNWSRPRDLAHYEDFEPYHASFYRHVEALSVTPYARRALDRGTTAMFVAAVRNSEEAYSRNVDAHDVPLDGTVVSGVVGRLLARASGIGGERAADYLRERIGVVVDRWNQAKTGAARLGYKTASFKKQSLLGLLETAGNGKWHDLTVGQSMRETENEINLLVAGKGEIYNPMFNAPEWTFTPSTAADDEPDPDEVAPPGDEIGVIAGPTTKKAQG